MAKQLSLKANANTSAGKPPVKRGRPRKGKGKGGTSDPKPPRGIPAAWDKIKMSPKLDQAARDFAGNKATSFESFMALSMAFVEERYTLLASRVITKQTDARAWLAHKLAPILVPTLELAVPSTGSAKVFRKWKTSDDPATRSAYQRWQSFTSHMDNAGVIGLRMQALGTDVVSNFPAMNTGKVRALSTAWKNACAKHKGADGKASPVSVKDPKQAQAASAILKKLYKDALTATREEIATWYRDPSKPRRGKGGAEDGPATAGGKRWDTHRKIIANIWANRYTPDQWLEIVSEGNKWYDQFKRAEGLAVPTADVALD